MELQAWGYWFELCMTVWYAVPLAFCVDNVNMFRILSILYERQVKNRADKSTCIWKIQILGNKTTKGLSLQEADFRCGFPFFENTQPKQMPLMWLEQMTRLLFLAAKSWHLYQKTHSNLRGHMFFKWLEISVSNETNFFISSGNLLHDFAQTFVESGLIVLFLITDLFGFPCISAMCSLIVCTVRLYFEILSTKTSVLIRFQTASIFLGFSEFFWVFTEKKDNSEMKNKMSSLLYFVKMYYSLRSLYCLCIANVSAVAIWWVKI